MTPNRSETEEIKDSRQTTGVEGLDQVLHGGLPSHRLYVVEGDPGSGKTTLALQFLREGVRLGQNVLYVTLSETLEELTNVARSHGWTLDGIDFIELDSVPERLAEEATYTVYHPADVELGETIRRIRAEVERLNPERVALDSVSELKILSQTSVRYRREILGLKQFFAGREMYRARAGRSHRAARRTATAEYRPWRDPAGAGRARVRHHQAPGPYRQNARRPAFTMAVTTLPSRRVDWNCILACPSGTRGM